MSFEEAQIYEENEMETLDGKFKSEVVEWLTESAHVPLTLVYDALERTKTLQRIKKPGKRFDHTSVWDAIQVYIWIQYIDRQREKDGVKDNVLWCTTTYVMKAMEWKHARTRDAITVLETKNLLTRKRYTIRNDRGQVSGSQQGLILVNKE